jgi:hypothetical protein
MKGPSLCYPMQYECLQLVCVEKYLGLIQPWGLYYTSSYGYLWFSERILRKNRICFIDQASPQND